MNGKTKPIGMLPKFLLKIYDMGFGLMLPLLRKNKRLQKGWPQRTLNDLPEACDLWIQAASGGEAYLALAILQRLDIQGLKALVTTNTNQGLEVLQHGLDELPADGVAATAHFCPFDKPAYMARYMAAVRPKTLVLLETELWPGMLYAAKRQGVKVLLANGRISYKSLKSYLKVKNLFRTLAPDIIMAISANDAGRFEELFPQANISIMPNIKFDRIQTAAAEADVPALAKYLTANVPFAVLGSVRKEEEEQVLDIIRGIWREHPRAVIGLYPRHMERLTHWQNALRDNDIPYQTRSGLNTPLACGSVLLGDIFGELMQAYQCAQAVFVGGSLAPLGGQNFMEPLAAGVVPVIGSSWKNFNWVGQGIIDTNLLVVRQTGHDVAKALNDMLREHLPKNEVKARFGAYIAQNLGGAQIVCDRLKKLL